MCSLQRSSFTWPGMTRSPVNSTKFMLRVARGRSRFGQAAIQLYPARQMQVSINLAVGGTHLQDNRVVDPIARCVGVQSAVCNRWREGKCRWIKFRDLQMKIYREDVAGSHRRKLKIFARGVSAGEIETDVVAHD